jgi:hypothetical protein
LVIAAVCSLSLLPANAMSQTVTAPTLDSSTLRARLARTWAGTGRAMPSDVADLDAMVAKKDFGKLTQRLRAANTADQVGLDMNWEQTQVYNGAGFIISYAYMFDLWRLGSAVASPTGDQLKQSAAMVFLYSLDLIALDGQRCADVSAPGHRQDQLFLQNKELIQYLRGLPRQTRMTLGTVSLDIESATAPLRQDDYVLCSGGLAQITQGLQAQGDKPLTQIPSAPGALPGKTYAVPPAPGYAPQFVNADVWGPKQANTRQTLPDTLTRLLTVPSDTPPTPPGK